MSIIPLHFQRRFEQRWAAQFGSLVIPSAPKNVGLKGSPVNVAPRAARAKEKPAGLSRRVRRLPFSGVSLYPPHRCFPSNGLAVLGSLIPSCRLGRLRLFLDWACRQLQYGSPLPRSEVSDKNDCTV